MGFVLITQSHLINFMLRKGSLFECYDETVLSLEIFLNYKCIMIQQRL